MFSQMHFSIMTLVSNVLTDAFFYHEACLMVLTDAFAIMTPVSMVLTDAFFYHDAVLYCV